MPSANRCFVERLGELRVRSKRPSVGLLEVTEGVNLLSAVRVLCA